MIKVFPAFWRLRLSREFALEIFILVSSSGKWRVYIICCLIAITDCLLKSANIIIS